MTRQISSLNSFPENFFVETADYIANTQSSDGSIPWVKDGPTDPWDHIEALMGLTIGGNHDQARKGFDWLKENQQKNGSWLAAYRDGKIEDGTRAETNYVAYIATGVWHFHLVTGDRPFLSEMWESVSRAIDFVLELQGSNGEIFWCLDTKKGIQYDCLLTGCSSIYKSLECAILIGSTLNKNIDTWSVARNRLGIAISDHPECFDQTWSSKERYAMDWFYPVLAGVIRKEEALKRINQRWDEFVETGWGCRCVSDQPWVTVAETCELVMALNCIGDRARAATLFSWLNQFRELDGSYWTGYVFPEKVLWPEERPTWTAGAVLLAADALTKKTKGSILFSYHASKD